MSNLAKQVTDDPEKLHVLVDAAEAAILVIREARGMWPQSMRTLDVETRLRQALENLGVEVNK